MQGTIALVDAAKKQGVSKFVLMSSLLTNGAAKGQSLNPTFLALNVFGGVLSKKLEVRLCLSCHPSKGLCAAKLNSVNSQQKPQGGAAMCILPSPSVAVLVH